MPEPRWPFRPSPPSSTGVESREHRTSSPPADLPSPRPQLPDQPLLRVAGHHPELVETAGLLVSELVTNVSLHTASLAVRLETVVRHDRVRVSVYDDEPAAPPPPSTPALGCENGRGLLLVEAMAQDWGVGEAHPSDPSRRGGKHLWFELLDRPTGGRSAFPQIAGEPHGRIPAGEPD